jgi:hypothetical protein
MPNYVKTGPFTNNITPPGISAALLNAIETVLSQPSGGTETGKYRLEEGAYSNLAWLSQYMSTISRTAVPVSVTIDEADMAHSNNANAAATQVLTANGFQVNCNTNGANPSAHVAGNTTVNY